jgi:hypothetical protein
MSACLCLVSVFDLCPPWTLCLSFNLCLLLTLCLCLCCLVHTLEPMSIPDSTGGGAASKRKSLNPKKLKSAMAWDVGVNLLLL